MLSTSRQKIGSTFAREIDQSREKYLQKLTFFRGESPNETSRSPLAYEATIDKNLQTQSSSSCAYEQRVISHLIWKAANLKIRDFNKQEKKELEETEKMTRSRKKLVKIYYN